LHVSLLPDHHEVNISSPCSSLWCSASQQAQKQWSQLIMDWNHAPK
jgi:hypothetical protein